MPALAANFELGTAAYFSAPAPDPYRYVQPEWQQTPVDPVDDALTKAGVDTSLITDEAKEAARTVLRLLSAYNTPEISAEDSEITLEWYKDSHHVVVLAVDGKALTWAASNGASPPFSGKIPFSNSIPAEAISAVTAAAT